MKTVFISPYLCLLWLFFQLSADQPVSRTGENSLTAHAQLLEKAKAGGIDTIFYEVLGPPAKQDHSPPPTGDPSALKR